MHQINGVQWLRGSFTWLVACRILFVRSVRCLSVSFTLTLFHAIFETIKPVWFSMFVRIWGQRPVSWIEFLTFCATFEFEIEDRRYKFPHSFFRQLSYCLRFHHKSYHIRLPEVSSPSYSIIREHRGQNESHRCECEWSIHSYCIKFLDDFAIPLSHYNYPSYSCGVGHKQVERQR